VLPKFFARLLQSVTAEIMREQQQQQRQQQQQQQWRQ
jgi:hypothetical protein